MPAVEFFLLFAVCGKDFKGNFLYHDSGKDIFYILHRTNGGKNMDPLIIGKFLKELRKQHHMTQELLGEKLGVTNKTISRWETGNYLPPIECLKLLSDLYQVSINEILAGKKLDEHEYKEASEDNISSTLEKAELDRKKFENKMTALMGVTTISAIIIILLLPGGDGLTAAEKIREILIVILVLAMAGIANTLNLIATVLRKNK